MRKLILTAASALLAVQPAFAYSHYPITAVPSPVKANVALMLVVLLFAATLLVITYKKKE